MIYLFSFSIESQGKEYATGNAGIRACFDVSRLLVWGVSRYDASNKTVEKESFLLRFEQLKIT